MRSRIPRKRNLTNRKLLTVISETAFVKNAKLEWYRKFFGLAQAELQSMFSIPYEPGHQFNP